MTQTGSIQAILHPETNLVYQDNDYQQMSLVQTGNLYHCYCETGAWFHPHHIDSGQYPACHNKNMLITTDIQYEHNGTNYYYTYCDGILKCPFANNLKFYFAPMLIRGSFDNSFHIQVKEFEQMANRLYLIPIEETGCRYGCDSVGIK